MSPFRQNITLTRIHFCAKMDSNSAHQIGDSSGRSTLEGETTNTASESYIAVCAERGLCGFDSYRHCLVTTTRLRGGSFVFLKEERRVYSESLIGHIFH